MSSYVYIARHRGNKRLIKVGWSQNLESGDRKLEKLIHEHLEDSHSYGEWYRLTDRVKNQIEEFDFLSDGSQFENAIIDGALFYAREQTEDARLALLETVAHYNALIELYSIRNKVNAR